MKITFVAGFKYRFHKHDGTHVDYSQAGSDGGKTLWLAEGGSIHVESEVFANVSEIEEIARPPKAGNER